MCVMEVSEAMRGRGVVCAHVWQVGHVGNHGIVSAVRQLEVVFLSFIHLF